mmetsp:Transcript_140/g.362  ORF Transcript_140/g.362 Transcript_140/m.362 type:complete len:86 (-) Transcript_140:266-523(-)
MRRAGIVVVVVVWGLGAIRTNGYADESFLAFLLHPPPTMTTLLEFVIFVGVWYNVLVAMEVGWDSYRDIRNDAPVLFWAIRFFIE